MRIHPWLALTLLGCAEPGPDASIACAALAEQWQEAGPFELVDCRERGGEMSEEAGTRRYLMQLEADLRVLETTQIFATGSLEHKSGPEGRGPRRPAGEVVTLSEEVVLVETADGWRVSTVAAAH